MTKAQATAVENAWRKHVTRNPVLIVHEEMNQEDLRAVDLVKREFGDKLKVVQARNGRDNDVVPRLLASVSIYRGLEDIVAFLEEISRATDKEPE